MSPVRFIKQAIATGADWLQRNGFYRLADKWGYGAATWSGENVTEKTACSHSVVWACRRLVCEAVAALPLTMMREVDGDKQPARDKPMYSALRYFPNEEMTTMTFRETLTGHALMQGVAYAKIDRRSGTGEAVGMWPLLPQQVTEDREKTGERRLVHIVKIGNSAEKTYPLVPGQPHEIFKMIGLSNDGVTGLSVLEYARQSLGNAQAVERYAGRFFATGGRQQGFIKVANKFKTTEDLKHFREDIDRYTQNPENSHKWPIFEPGMEFQPGTFSPQDSQFLETRQFNPSEICRWFGVAPHMVGDLLRGTFSNIEHQDLEFVKRTLTAWLKRWEQNLMRCVLTEQERQQGYFFHHNMNALVRGDFATRMAGYATALQNGFMSQNEVRSLEDMNRFEGGDDYHVQLNMQTLPGGTPTTAERAQLAKIGSASKGRF
jgi:HK97 family phage portal protein